MNIDEFISRYPNRNTKHGYRATLKLFFNVVGITDPNSYFNNRNNEQIEKDVELFYQQRIKQGCAPKTISSDIGCLKTFLSYNRVDLPSVVWRSMRQRMKGTRARTQDRIPEPHELKAILSHMDTRGRAFYLTMVSSGMRIDEVTNITFKDIHLDEDPCRIVIRGNHTKTGETRTVFVSCETREAIQEWLKIRQHHLDVIKRRFPRGTENTKDDRIFPFGNRASRCLWNDALKKSGLEEFDDSLTCLVNSVENCKGRRTLHPHSLRKYFATHSSFVVGHDITEALLGHQEGLDAVYKKYQGNTVKELAELYKQKIEPKVSVYSNTEELMQLKETVGIQSKKIDTQSQSIDAILEQRNTRIDKLELTLATLIGILQANNPDEGTQKYIQNINYEPVAKTMQRDIGTHVNDSA